LTTEMNGPAFPTTAFIEMLRHSRPRALWGVGFHAGLRLLWVRRLGWRLGEVGQATGIRQPEAGGGQAGTTRSRRK
jgi:hypothetical protein